MRKLLIFSILSFVIESCHKEIRDAYHKKIVEVLTTRGMALERGGGHSGPALLHNFPKLKKSNSGPKVLRKEFSTEYMQQKCNILPYSVDLWIGN